MSLLLSPTKPFLIVKASVRHLLPPEHVSTSHSSDEAMFMTFAEELCHQLSKLLTEFPSYDTSATTECAVPAVVFLSEDKDRHLAHLAGCLHQILPEYYVNDAHPMFQQLLPLLYDSITHRGLLFGSIDLFAELCNAFILLVERRYLPFLVLPDRPVLRWRQMLGLFEIATKLPVRVRDVKSCRSLRQSLSSNLLRLSKCANQYFDSNALEEQVAHFLPSFVPEVEALQSEFGTLCSLLPFTECRVQPSQIDTVNSMLDFLWGPTGSYTWHSKNLNGVYFSWDFTVQIATAAKLVYVGTEREKDVAPVAALTKYAEPMWSSILTAMQFNTGGGTEEGPRRTSSQVGGRNVDMFLQNKGNHNMVLQHRQAYIATLLPADTQHPLWTHLSRFLRVTSTFLQPAARTNTGSRQLSCFLIQLVRQFLKRVHSERQLRLRQPEIAAKRLAAGMLLPESTVEHFVEVMSEPIFSLTYHTQWPMWDMAVGCVSLLCRLSPTRGYALLMRFVELTLQSSEKGHQNHNNNNNSTTQQSASSTDGTSKQGAASAAGGGGEVAPHLRMALTVIGNCIPVLLVEEQRRSSLSSKNADSTNNIHTVPVDADSWPITLPITKQLLQFLFESVSPHLLEHINTNDLTKALAALRLVFQCAIYFQLRGLCYAVEAPLGANDSEECSFMLQLSEKMLVFCENAEGVPESILKGTFVTVRIILESCTRQTVEKVAGRVCDAALRQTKSPTAIAEFLAQVCLLVPDVCARRLMDPLTKRLLQPTITVTDLKWYKSMLSALITGHASRIAAYSDLILRVMQNLRRRATNALFLDIAAGLFNDLVAAMTVCYPIKSFDVETGRLQGRTTWKHTHHDQDDDEGREDDIQEDIYSDDLHSLLPRVFQSNEVVVHWAMPTAPNVDFCMALFNGYLQEFEENSKNLSPLVESTQKHLETIFAGQPSSTSSDDHDEPVTESAILRGCLHWINRVLYSSWRLFATRPLVGEEDYFYSTKEPGILSASFAAALRAKIPHYQGEPGVPQHLPPLPGTVKCAFTADSIVALLTECLPRVIGTDSAPFLKQAFASFIEKRATQPRQQHIDPNNHTMLSSLPSADDSAVDDAFSVRKELQTALSFYEPSPSSSAVPPQGSTSTGDARALESIITGLSLLGNVAMYTCKLSSISDGYRTYLQNWSHQFQFAGGAKWMPLVYWEMTACAAMSAMEYRQPITLSPGLLVRIIATVQALTFHALPSVHEAARNAWPKLVQQLDAPRIRAIVKLTFEVLALANHRLREGTPSAVLLPAPQQANEAPLLLSSNGSSKMVPVVSEHEVTGMLAIAQEALNVSCAIYPLQVDVVIEVPEFSNPLQESLRSMLLHKLLEQLPHRPVCGSALPTALVESLIDRAAACVAGKPNKACASLMSASEMIRPNMFYVWRIASFVPAPVGSTATSPAPPPPSVREKSVSSLLRLCVNSHKAVREEALAVLRGLLVNQRQSVPKRFVPATEFFGVDKRPTESNNWFGTVLGQITLPRFFRADCPLSSQEERDNDPSLPAELHWRIRQTTASLETASTLAPLLYRECGVSPDTPIRSTWLWGVASAVHNDANGYRSQRMQLWKGLARAIGPDAVVPRLVEISQELRKDVLRSFLAPSSVNAVQSAEGGGSSAAEAEVGGAGAGGGATHRDAQESKLGIVAAIGEISTAAIRASKRHLTARDIALQNFVDLIRFVISPSIPHEVTRSLLHAVMELRRSLCASEGATLVEHVLQMLETESKGGLSAHSSQTCIRLLLILLQLLDLFSYDTIAVAIAPLVVSRIVQRMASLFLCSPLSQVRVHTASVLRQLVLCVQWHSPHLAVKPGERPLLDLLSQFLHFLLRVGDSGSFETPFPLLEGVDLSRSAPQFAQIATEGSAARLAWCKTVTLLCSYPLASLLRVSADGTGQFPNLHTEIVRHGVLMLDWKLAESDDDVMRSANSMILWSGLVRSQKDDVMPVMDYLVRTLRQSPSIDSSSSAGALPLSRQSRTALCGLLRVLLFQNTHRIGKYATFSDIVEAALTCTGFPDKRTRSEGRTLVAVLCKVASREQVAALVTLLLKRLKADEANRAAGLPSPQAGPASWGSTAAPPTPVSTGFRLEESPPFEAAVSPIVSPALSAASPLPSGQSETTATPPPLPVSSPSAAAASFASVVPERLGLCVALCGILMSDPDEVLPYTVKLMERLAPYARDRTPEVANEVRSAFQQWWATHKHRWDSHHKANFTESQLEMKELFTSLSYYV